MQTPTTIQLAEAINGIECASFETEMLSRSQRGKRPELPTLEESLVAWRDQVDYWRTQFDESIEVMNKMARRVVDAEAKLGAWQLSTIVLGFVSATLLVAFIIK